MNREAVGIHQVGAKQDDVGHTSGNDYKGSMTSGVPSHRIPFVYRETLQPFRIRGIIVNN